MNMTRYLTLIIALIVLATPASAGKYTMKCDYEIQTVEIDMTSIVDFANFATIIFKDEGKPIWMDTATTVPVGDEIYGFRMNGREFKYSFHLSIYKNVVGEKDGVSVWESHFFPANRVEQYTIGSCYIDGL